MALSSRHIILYLLIVKVGSENRKLLICKYTQLN